MFIELSNDHELVQITPNYQAIVESSSQIKEVVIMSPSGNPAYDFLLRSFCPWIGIDEAPVTGSAHAVLAHYWQEKTRKDTLPIRLRVGEERCS
ncbi:PhzF family phenazine biosynthesis protein [Rhodocytophaga rosea]|uniref:PhzF family phenazine biosynthesis protein n=1 Tax=Rhodocytophaga rosea TaxID=2704465 RepID=A0A6C0GJR9_9BACT|nr:PhzF family phenazine biosynthesis protein [Rhodocytophaga rosea]QHT68187.1 PhzF family phenazine biosynthesis protein [Rhodocytophaga rosea]